MTGMDQLLLHMQQLDTLDRKKGQKLSFNELYSWLCSHPEKRWRLYAVGGSFGFLNFLRWDEVWEAGWFDITKSGHKVFRFAAFDNENHFIQEIPFADYPECQYNIQIFNENPLEILIDMRDETDDVSNFAIFQER